MLEQCELNELTKQSISVPKWSDGASSLLNMVENLVAERRFTMRERFTCLSGRQPLLKETLRRLHTWSDTHSSSWRTRSILLVRLKWLLRKCSVYDDWNGKTDVCVLCSHSEAERLGRKRKRQWLYWTFETSPSRCLKWLRANEDIVIHWNKRNKLLSQCFHFAACVCVLFTVWMQMWTCENVTSLLYLVTLLEFIVLQPHCIIHVLHCDCGNCQLQGTRWKRRTAQLAKLLQLRFLLVFIRNCCLVICISCSGFSDVDMLFFIICHFIPYKYPLLFFLFLK